jgi:hypothetical protein
MDTTGVTRMAVDHHSDFAEVALVPGRRIAGVASVVVMTTAVTLLVDAMTIGIAMDVAATSIASVVRLGAVVDRPAQMSFPMLRDGSKLIIRCRLVASAS